MRLGVQYTVAFQGGVMSDSFFQELTDSFWNITLLFSIGIAVGVLYGLVVGPTLMNDITTQDKLLPLTVSSLFLHNFGLTVLEMMIGSLFIWSAWIMGMFNGAVLGLYFAMILTTMPVGDWMFGLLLILPHGIIEIPALLLGLSLADRYYYSLNKSRKEYFCNLKFLPLLAVMFFCAAYIEARVTLKIVHFFYASAIISN